MNRVTLLRRSTLLGSALALSAFLLPAQGLRAEENAASQVKRDNFQVFQISGNFKVDAIRLFEVSPNSPGRLVWIEPDGSVRSSTDEDFLRLVPALTTESSARKPQKVKGLLTVLFRNVELTRMFFETDKVATFSFVEKNAELEIASVVISDPGPPPPTYRIAFAWRYKKKEKVKDTGSAVANAMEGQEVPVQLAGSSMEDDIKVKFLVEEPPVPAQ